MRVIAVLFLAIGLVLPAAAAEIKADHVSLSAFVEAPLQPGGTTWVAIRQVIEPGWHTYWRNPGDSGLATSIGWTLPAGITAGAPLWPAPQRFTDGAIVNYGYAGTATLLVPLRAAAGSQIAPVQAKVNLLECEHMCIPEEVTLAIDPRTASSLPRLFDEARAALPRLFHGSARAAIDGQFLVLTLRGAALKAGLAANSTVFPVTAGVIDDDARPEIRVAGDTLTWRAHRAVPAKAPSAFAAVVTIPGAGAFAAASPVVARAASAPPSAAAADPSLVGAMLLAFLGGLILNLMPCVFPILFIKVLALAKIGGDLRAARREGAFYAAGVFATFCGLAGVLLILRTSGQMLGWGFQLQSPYVVLALCLLMTAIGLNLLGVFEIPMALAGAGDRFTKQAGGRGAFFTGALAVVVASPCTAPFMGAALGFAFTQPAMPALLVVLALGVGFALPFSLLAATPAPARRIPRPGAWMVRFKQLLGFPMLATAVWLLWVLDRQTGPDGVAIALMVVLALVFLIWLAPLLNARLRGILAVTGAAGLILLASSLHTAEPQTGASGDWAPWTPKAVADALGSGHPVLVDFSAAWCVTCLVNERYALRDGRVAAQFKRQGVVVLRADWTDRDAAIAAELHRYKRSGVPLYVFHTQGGREILLPQLLTPDSVLSALSQAAN